MYVHFYDISSGIIITTAILVTSQKNGIFPSHLILHCLRNMDLIQHEIGHSNLKCQVVLMSRVQLSPLYEVAFLLKRLSVLNF